MVRGFSRISYRFQLRGKTSGGKDAHANDSVLQTPVYEYRFTAPNIFGENKQWWIMWDYYNGLVRVHDFFDCCKPGKVSLSNDGACLTLR
jgi:hypothetical protein